MYAAWGSATRWLNGHVPLLGSSGKRVATALMAHSGPRSSTRPIWSDHSGSGTEQRLVSKPGISPTSVCSATAASSSAQRNRIEPVQGSGDREMTVGRILRRTCALTGRGSLPCGPSGAPQTTRNTFRAMWQRVRARSTTMATALHFAGVACPSSIRPMRELVAYRKRAWALGAPGR